MMFQRQLRRARIMYAVMMATFTCILMSAVSTYVLRGVGEFWNYWPHVLTIDLAIAIPVAIMLGPIVRRICNKVYPELPRS